MTDDNITLGEYMVLTRQAAAMAPTPQESLTWMEHIDALEAQLNYLNRCLDLDAYEPQRSL